MLLADDSHWDLNAFHDLVSHGLDTAKWEDRLPLFHCHSQQLCLLQVRSAGEGTERSTCSKLSLVDLAGSERTKKTGVTGQQMRVGRMACADVTCTAMAGSCGTCRAVEPCCIRLRKGAPYIRRVQGSSSSTCKAACQANARQRFRHVHVRLPGPFKAASLAVQG